MSRKIIVLGMDNTGKTTLVEQLSNEFKCDHIKSLGPGYTKEEMKEEMIRKLNIEELVVLERFSIFEELVYGPILRGISKFDKEDIEEIRSYDPIIIYCRPDNETIFNFGDREQMEGVIEQRVKLVNAWDKLIAELKINYNFDIIPYNWTEKRSLMRLKHEITERLENEYNTCRERNN